MAGRYLLSSAPVLAQVQLAQIKGALSTYFKLCKAISLH